MYDSDSDFEWYTVNSDSVLGSEDFESTPSSPCREAACFRYADSDSEAGGSATSGLALEDMFRFNPEDVDWDGDALEDVYSFDPDKVAAALRDGADFGDLVNVIADSMAENLDSLVSEHFDPSPECMDEDLSGRMTPGRMTPAGDLAGRMTPGRMTPALDLCMTPGRMTPLGTEEAAVVAGHTPQVLEGVASKVADLLSSPARQRRSLVCGSPAKPRRSSMVQIRPRLSMAVEQAYSKHGSSLAKAAARELGSLQETIPDEDAELKGVTADIQHQVYKSCCRKRMSLIKAAEVLEVAGIDEDSDEGNHEGEGISAAVTEKLKFVQEAVDAARRRHRESMVARAAPAANEETHTSRRCKDPRFVALMRTRASVVGRPVHCGPTPKKRMAQVGRQKRGGG